MKTNIQAVLLALIAAVFFLAAPDAKACRDCPFPMKIGEKKWLMPDSHTVVMIEEIDFGSSYNMTVVLMDSVTGELMASGTVYRPKGQRSVTILLLDRQGRRVYGNITWVNYKDSVIRARFDYEDNGY
jgi:hypothetical protein